MNWNILSEIAQLDGLKEESRQKPVVIFKHSIRCSISSMAKSRLERSQAPEGVSFYYLDLINNRALSNQVAETFGVHHESPQVLLLRNGDCVYDESHNGIDMQEIANEAFRNS
ncbi:MAG: bacillithiol system redox-active protein YtxJ [Sphingobacteriales bacterium]|nr:MAG: bacillithiol system redox-active protein YtxJ [Sphingobacteriales bacterium]